MHSVQKTDRKIMEVSDMKGYTTAEGYMGFVNGRYMLFASETEYKEYVEN